MTRVYAHMRPIYYGTAVQRAAFPVSGETDGSFFYELDTNILYQYAGGWIVNATGWTDWTPTIDQAGAVACTVTTARYNITNGLCHVEVILAVTAAGTAGNDIVIGGQPAAIYVDTAVGVFPFGLAQVYDAGTATYMCRMSRIADQQWKFHYMGVTAAATYVGTNPNFALANGDYLAINATYKPK